MALTWINEARNNLSVASNNYAKLQREIDKYNKLFQAYALASPETQMRAASVMKQAINEYNGLKAQQEDSALRIYEAQNWVNYYNNMPSEVQVNPVVNQAKPISPELLNNLPQVNIDTWTYEETPAVQETPVLDTTVPGSSAIANVPVQATNEPVLTPEAQAKINNARAILWGNNKVRNYASTYKPTAAQTQTPKYQSTTIKPATTQWARNISINRSWAWNVAGINSGSSLVTGLRYK